jgi:secondary thiamine-phosphate synthase enzyme
MVATLPIRSRRREELINIDGLIADFVEKSGVSEGALTVFVPHTTAGVTINENADPTVAEDVVRGLARIAPLRDDYRHAEGNSDAHIKSSLVGQSATLVVSEGKPLLGTWQSVYFCEFDGPRNRSVILRI